MEAESVGPETEKGGSRQEKDEVAVGWAAQCGGRLAVFLILARKRRRWRDLACSLISSPLESPHLDGKRHRLLHLGGNPIAP